MNDNEKWFDEYAEQTGVNKLHSNSTDSEIETALSAFAQITLKELLRLQPLKLELIKMQLKTHLNNIKGKGAHRLVVAAFKF